MELTQELVKELFQYIDGILYWKIRKGKIMAGSRAGTISKAKGGNRIRVRVNRKFYLSYRIIFLYHNGFLPETVDHEDRDCTNDKIENLRAATKSQNQMNRTSTFGSTSIYLGVSLLRGKYWRATITNHGNVKHIGSFPTEELAALAYNRAAVMLHKEFANLNIIGKICSI